MKQGIKEVKELIEGLAVAHKALKLVLADGKIDLSDAVAVAKLQGELPVLLAGVDGLALALEEIKDLDGAEAIELIKLLIEKLKAV
jgi:hypothetical protein